MVPEQWIWIERRGGWKVALEDGWKNESEIEGIIPGQGGSLRGVSV